MRSSRSFLLAAVPIILGALSVSPASALEANVCMQTNWANHGNSQTLGCTSNDVSVARVTNIAISSGGECHLENGVNKCTCFGGGNVTFAADYEVKLTAQARYDIGIYFSTDGDSNNDGALTGQCKLITIDSSNSTNYVNLDAAPDACGDIDAAHNPQILHLTLTTACQAGGDGKLRLPNCTSWRQPGSNEVCQVATDAYPGSPSKCNCQAGFTVDIFVETGSVEVTKTVLNSTLTENGGDVVYKVSVKNLAQVATLTLNSLSDNLYGNITTTGHDGITATTCATGGTIPPGNVSGNPYECQFTVHVNGPLAKGTVIEDKVTACGTDNFGHSNLCDDATAQVTVQDTVPTAAGCKTVDSFQCSIVRYNVVISNADPAEALNLNTLADDKFGSITASHAAGGGFEAVVGTTCGRAAGDGTFTGVTGAGALPKSIGIGGNYSCQFDGVICATGTHTNKITATLSDDDGNNITWPDANDAGQVAKATAAVTINGISSAKTTCSP